MEFIIRPILGRKTDVQANDKSLLQMVGDNVALAYDVGGLNFDLNRVKSSCSKAFGQVQWSNSANAQATKCLGLFELYDGTNRDHIMFDNGKMYVFDSALDPINKDAAAPVTFATDNVDLYSIIKVGNYIVFADRAEHTPYKWKNGDANLTKLIASGTEYQFRYLVPFQRRVIGLYSDQTDGSIDVRWSTAWPATAITSLNYPAANQLYIPTDDPIVGGNTMGQDRCFIYSENSISQLVYYPDYETPFRLINVVPRQGGVNHHSIVSLGDRHYMFNRNYGFCEYRGGPEFPYGGKPISADIEPDVQGINSDYYDLIVGTFIPLTRQVVWTVPHAGQTTPSALYFYDIDTGQWTIEDKAMRYVAEWRMFATYTWNNLITDLGGTGALWSAAGNNTWAFYTSARQRLVYGNIDGHLYYESGDILSGGTLNGYRVEPMLDFGNPKRQDYLREIWFDTGTTSAISLDVFWRGGDTAGECLASGWTTLDTVSINSPEFPVCRLAKTARIHQIKWGTDSNSELFQVNEIKFVFQPGGEV